MADFPFDEVERDSSIGLAEPFPARGFIEVAADELANNLRYLKAEGRHVYAMTIKGVARYRLDFYTPEKNNSEKGCTQQNLI